MSSLNAHCPPADELRAYSLGKLSPEEAAAVESYLADHPECAAVLEAAPDDEVVRLLRGLRARPATETGLSPGLTTEDPADDRRRAALPDCSAHEGEAPADAPPAGVAEALANHPRYRLLCKLGEGGMGTVYLAEHRLMRRPVALKVIRAEWLSHPQAVARFRREVAAAAQLHHPNVVHAYDADEVDGSHFLVMEYVNGVPLDRWLAERGPLPIAEACSYARQAALGLQAAHDRGLVHRDLKPHNLMRTPDGTVKVLDFGLARLATDHDGAAEGTVTYPGGVMGTPDYMAPEQGQDSRTADTRSDVYSLGCTLYHLLSGRPPFPEGTAVQKIFRHALERPPRLTDLRPDVPAALARVVARMMAPRPADRYQSAAEAAAALAPFARPPVSQPGRRRWRRAAVVAALLLLCAAVAAGVAYYIERLPRPEPGPVARPDPRPARLAELPDQPGYLRTLPKGNTRDDATATFSADGRLVVLPMDITANQMEYLRVYETATGQRLRDLTLPGETFSGWAFGADDRLLYTAVGHGRPGSRVMTLRVWDLETGDSWPLTGADALEADWAVIGLSDDGKRMWVNLWAPRPAVSGGVELRVLDVAGGRVLLRVNPPPHAGTLCRHACLSPDGRRLAMTTCWLQADKTWTGGRLTVRDVDGRRPPVEISAEGFVGEPAFAPQGGRIAAQREHGGEGWVESWDPDSGQSVGRTNCGRGAHQARPLAGGLATLCIDPDRRLRTLSAAGQETFRGEVVPAYLGISASRDGRMAAFLTATGYRLYRLPDPRGQ